MAQRERTRRRPIVELLQRMQQNREKREEKVPDSYAGTPGQYPVGYTVMRTTAPAPGGGTQPLTVAVWYPTAAATEMTAYELGENVLTTRLARNAAPLAGPFPLVLYSHGATGSGLNMAFGTERLAAEGFIVAAPDYTDKYYAARIDGKVRQTAIQKVRILGWLRDIREHQLNTGGKKYRHEHLAYRPQQASAAIDKLLAENKNESSPFFQRIDAGKIAAIGHSFGAWTSTLIGGADPLFADARIKAVLAMSGPVNENVYERDEIGNIRVPVLFMYGEAELEQGRGNDKTLFYDRANTPKYLVSIKDADHFTFSGGISKEFDNTVAAYLERDARRATIVKYIEVFLKYHLKDDAAAGSALRKRDPLVGVLLYKEK